MNVPTTRTTHPQRGIPPVYAYFRWLQVLSEPRRVLGLYKKEVDGTHATTEDLIAFYRSPSYRGLPSRDRRIRAKPVADRGGSRAAFAQVLQVPSLGRARKKTA